MRDEAGRAGGAAPSSVPLLEEALARIPRPHLEARRITKIRLTDYFSLVELDDGSVGAAMSYFSSDPKAMARASEALELSIAKDPLLLEHTRAVGEENPVYHTVRAAVVNALSSASLKNPSNEFAVNRKVPIDLFEGVSRVALIGFGGFMFDIAASPNVSSLSIGDLLYRQRRREMERAVQLLRERRPMLDITLWDGSEPWRVLRRADLVCITGSALCNGTMERLLWDAGGCHRVVVQGQSAAIHPIPFFNRGVGLVATTIKPRSLMQATTEGLRAALEGDLPFVYLTPEKPSSLEGDARWFAASGGLYRENGYKEPPIAFYRSLSRLVDRPGPTLDLGCGNGSLLRYLCRHASHRIVPFGIDIREEAITRAKKDVLPEYAANFSIGDIKALALPVEAFSTILVNPFHVFGDASKEAALDRLVVACLAGVAPGGCLILCCGSGQIAKLAAMGVRLAALNRYAPQRSHCMQSEVTFFTIHRAA